MSKINLVTPPDIIYSDAINLLLVFPSTSLQDEMQQEILPNINDGMNVYIYDKKQNNDKDLKWLLNVFSLADVVIIDVDQCPSHVRDLLSYMIAKPKTYWLTNAVDTVYNHISSNKIYNLSVLRNLGGSVEENQINE